MKKKYAIPVTVLGFVLVVVTGMVLRFFGFSFSFGFKGQSRDEIDITTYGTNAEIRDDTKSIEECSADEVIYICNTKLKDMLGYHATITGSVSALGGMYTQTVSGEEYFGTGGAVYITKSTSAFVSVGKKIYIDNNGKVFIREAENVKKDTWKEDLTEYNYDDYIVDYGVDFRELTNYVINEQTIKSASLVGVKNSVYTYSIELDEEKATLGYRVNMAKMGDLSSLPEFNSCRFEISLNENFEPLEITCYDNYRVEKLGGITCSSVLTITFDIINEAVEIPNI